MTRQNKIEFLEARGWTTKSAGLWWSKGDSGNVRMEKALELTPIMGDPMCLREDVLAAQEATTAILRRQIDSAMEEALVEDVKRVRRDNTYHYWERLGA